MLGAVVPQIERILCPVDFSDASRHAIEHAVMIARWYDAQITALHVFNPIYVPVPGLAALDAGDNEALQQSEMRRLYDETLCWFARPQALGIHVDVRVQKGSPAKAIVDCAASVSADVIVLGTHGAGGFEHLVLGSVTEKVLRTAACPVLTVPPRAAAASRLPFRRLLCPVDFSHSSVSALQFALSLAEEGDAELIVLHVVEWPPQPETPPTRPVAAPESHEDCERQLKCALDDLIPASARVWCRPVTRLGHGKPYREILGIATEEAVDLIVMGVHGRTPLDLMLFGSSTNHVVRRAMCPVLTVRGRPPA